MDFNAGGKIMKEGNIYDIGQTVNGVSRFLYINDKWYYARSIVLKYNYDESELTKTVLDDEEPVKLIGNILDDIKLRNSLDFSNCPEILAIIRDNKLDSLFKD
jgi:hypothetical protein